MAKRTLVAVVAVGLVAVAPLACGGGKNLSRGKAEDLVRSARPWLAKPFDSLTISSEQFEKGARVGLWSRNGDVSPEAALYIKSVGEYGGKKMLLLVDTYRVEFEVTGITDAPMSEGKVKEIEYSWRYIDLPIIAETFATSGGSGGLLARLYDDGFRLAGGDSWVYSRDPYAASERAKDLIAELTKSIAERRDQEAAAKAAADRARDALLAQSKTPTKRATRFMTLTGLYRDEKYEIALTDVSIDDGVPLPAWRAHNVWFGFIKDFKKGTQLNTVNNTVKPCVNVHALEHGVSVGGGYEFASEPERDAFFDALTLELAAWRAKYSSLLN